VTLAFRRGAAEGGPAEIRFGRHGGCLYRDLVTTQVIVLNGGSSSGKSGIVRYLQAVLPDPWLAAALDSLIEAMPASMWTSAAGIEITSGGGVNIGSEFRRLQAAWMEGVAAMARAGAGVIVDDVFLGGAASQQGWRKALGGLNVLWVGVRCERTVAAGREVARGDRVRGLAVSQAEMVHRGVVYDLEVDTTHAESLECARTIATQVM
jgi:chloramphenicol 3-O phosphotransferase